MPPITDSGKYADLLLGDMSPEIIEDCASRLTNFFISGQDLLIQDALVKIIWGMNPQNGFYTEAFMTGCGNHLLTYIQKPLTPPPPDVSFIDMRIMSLFNTLLDAFSDEVYHSVTAYAFYRELFVTTEQLHFITDPKVILRFLKLKAMFILGGRHPEGINKQELLDTVLSYYFTQLKVDTCSDFVAVASRVREHFGEKSALWLEFAGWFQSNVFKLLNDPIQLELRQYVLPDLIDSAN